VSRTSRRSPRDIKYAVALTFVVHVINGRPDLLQDPSSMTPQTPTRAPTRNKDPNHLGLACDRTPDDKTIILQPDASRSPMALRHYACSAPRRAQSAKLNAKTGGAKLQQTRSGDRSYKSANYSPTGHRPGPRQYYRRPTDARFRPTRTRSTWGNNLDPDTEVQRLSACTYDSPWRARGAINAMQSKLLSDPSPQRGRSTLDRFTPTWRASKKVSPFDKLEAARRSVIRAQQ